MKKLRIVRAIVQVETVWDDGEELTPGPTIDPVILPYSALGGFVEGLPAQLESLTQQFARAE